jgi:hypothetical protein
LSAGSGAGKAVAMKHAPLCLALSFALTGCATAPPPQPADGFFANLRSLCGQAYAGRLVTNEAADADMVGKPMVMHVATCSDSEIRVPFHVGTDGGGWDRSRTWVISRTANGLRLKHDHRHEDGSHDAVTMYGGDTAVPGSATAQAFPVDAESIAMFRREGLVRSVTNVWTVEVAPGARFAYQLRRTGENARHFRVEFDLTRRVDAPPAPWGY